MYYFIAEDAVTWKSTLPELTQLRSGKAEFRRASIWRPGP